MKLAIPRAESEQGNSHLPVAIEGDDPSWGEGSTQVLTRPQEKLKKPSMYKVLLLNDDYTPMDFVVHVLKKFFHRNEVESNRIMLQVHHQGAGLAGIYTHEIAETKLHQTNVYAQKNGHPLKCIMEEESTSDDK